jgi:hypothetical protein
MSSPAFTSDMLGLNSDLLSLDQLLRNVQITMRLSTGSLEPHGRMSNRL